MLQIVLMLSLLTPSADVRAGDSRVLSVKAYSQKDPAWAKERIGGSNETIKKVGCVVTSVAMTFDYYGIATDPKQLNDFLKEHRGYNQRGWLSWRKAAKYTKGKLELAYYGAADRAIINRHLAKRRPVIVKTRTKRGSIHWVLVVGKRGRDYLVMDPLNRGDKPVRLSKIARKMLAARVYAPTR